jgi:hypothetical protein
MTDYKQTGDYVAAQKLDLACRNIQHLLKIQEEQISLNAIVDSLQESLGQAHANNPSDMRDILVTQTRILDATFHYYMHNAHKSTYTSDDKVTMALRAQRQTERTISMWSRLTERDKQSKNPRTN